MAGVQRAPECRWFRRVRHVAKGGPFHPSYRAPPVHGGLSSEDDSLQVYPVKTFRTPRRRHYATRKSSCGKVRTGGRLSENEDSSGRAVTLTAVSGGNSFWFAHAYLRVPLHQVPEALQLRAVDQPARQAAPRLPEMQVAGSGADALDVFRQDGSQELAGRCSSAEALHAGGSLKFGWPFSPAKVSHRRARALGGRRLKAWTRAG